MASRTKTEPFPAMSSSERHATGMSSSKGMRRRRGSSSLGADPRGDTGASAMATSNLKPQITPPRSPESSHPLKQRGHKRRKAKRVLNRWKRLALKHTWLTPLILTLTILAAYFVSPGEHNPLHSAIFLSYPNPPLNEQTTTLPAHIGNVTQYGKGRKDFAFVAFYTIVLSFTREFLMQRLIRPIAIYCGICRRGKQSRFMEQFYTAIYFAIMGPYGLYVMSRTPVWYFNTAGMYDGFPHRAHEAVFKAYYLLQASYWAQQGLVLMLQLEKPRKDFKELVLHHIVTLALIGLSYRFHFTYMGVAVYITHDISDFFLATSKVLNYLDSALTIPYFVVFMLIWAYLRHLINLRIIYSLFPYDFSLSLPTHLPYIQQKLNLPESVSLQLPFPANEFATVGPYTLIWETEQYKCWISQIITFALLLVLQAVNIFWFFLICRILVRYLWTSVAEDDRSEDEAEDEVEGELVEKGRGVVAVQEKGTGEKSEMSNGAPYKGPKVEVYVNGVPRGAEMNGTMTPRGEGYAERKATLRKR